MRKIHIYKYIDSPLKHGLLSLTQLSALVTGVVFGFIMFGGIGVIFGGVVGLGITTYVAGKNKKGALKKYSYFSFPGYRGQYKGLPKGHERFFL